MPSVSIVYFDAGGGHRTTACAIREAIVIRNYGWNVELLNLGDILAPIDPFSSLFGIKIHELYNRILRTGMTAGFSLYLKALISIIRATHAQQVRLLKNQWHRSTPDLVISVVPLFNRAFYDSLPGGRLVTVLTDRVDLARHFWIEPQQQFFVCGSPESVKQAHTAGVPERFVYQTSGMVIHPKFYAHRHVDVAAGRIALGLNPTVPTGVAMWGDQGSRSMIDLIKNIKIAKSCVQMIFVCGHNELIARELDRYSSYGRTAVVRYTDAVDHYMRIAEFFVGKPGPGCISEALAMRLPLIVESNHRTLPQERHNAAWIDATHTGIVVKTCRQAIHAIDRLLTQEWREQMLERIPQFENNAVWEVADLLENILHTMPQDRHRCADSVSSPTLVDSKALAH